MTVENGAVADWHSFMTDELRADPVVAGWAEKASEKDVQSILKSHAHAQKRLGSAVNLPGADAKPEDVQAFKQRLYDAKLFNAPPKLEDYKFEKPATLPDGVGWNDDLQKEFATVLHKHGVPVAAVADLMSVYMKGLTGASEALAVDREQSLAQIKSEHGEQFEARKEMVKRMSDALFKDPKEVEFFERTGLGNHPQFLSVLMRLAPLAMQDSSFVESLGSAGGAEGDGAAARDEYMKIASDPKHPMHAGYLNRDPKVEAYIDGLYKKAYPGVSQ